MAIQYKSKCISCKKNYVLITYKQRYPVCYDCQKSELEGKIKDPKMKRLFNISEEFYKQNAFLRSIKINYLKYGELSDKQIKTFKEVVKKLKNPEKE
tara:strand:- start:66 stop:356 length:291 start_codon:yes stop_codon:yes gene_type:complete